jgi:hypothetical protein
MEIDAVAIDAVAAPSRDDSDRSATSDHGEAHAAAGPLDGGVGARPARRARPPRARCQHLLEP